MPPSTTAQIQLTASASQLPSMLRTAAGYVVSFASGVKSVLSKINLAPKALAGRNWVQHAMGQVTARGAERGLDFLVDQGKQVFDFNDKLVRFGIAAKMSGMMLDYVGRTAREVSSETGKSAISVLDAARAYVDLAGAANFSAEKMRVLARAGQASEAEGADLAGMMYQLTTSMKVADGQMENTMGGLINQAKEGAIEAKQMAKEFGAMMPLYAKFGVLGREGAVQAGAMFQVIRDGYNTADEAGTGIVRIFAGIRSNASRFEKAGVKIWNIDKDGFRTARHFSEIFRDIQKSDLMKNPELLKKAFGRTEAWRGFEMLVKNLEKLAQMEKAGMVDGVISQDLATYTESSAGRIAVAMERMKNKIAEAFTPERIEAFVNAIEGLADKAGPLAEMVGKIADGVSALYNTGKFMRKMFTPGDSVLRSTTPEEAARFGREHGVSLPEAYKRLQEDWAKTVKFKKEVDALMPNDRTTKESDKRAVRAYMESGPGSDMQAAAMSYIYAAGMSPSKQREIEAQVRKEMQDEAIRTGRGFSEAPQPGTSAISPDQFKDAMGQAIGIQDIIRNQAAADAAAAAQQRAEAQRVAAQQLADFQRAMVEQMAPAIGRSVADALAGNPPPALHLDGNRVSQSTGSATDNRRR